jgi:hypothetical protein
VNIPPLARVLFAMAAAPGCVCAQARMAVAVFNYAGAPHAVLTHAVETARMAYRAVGIETEWTVCDSESCPQAPSADGHYLELLVMPRLRGSMPGRPAGYAAIGGPFLRPRAYAFYDAVKSVADRTLRPASLVLGCVLVHETAHLLGLQHQSRGAMRASLDGGDMDSVATGRAFSAEEGQQLRAATDATRWLRAAAGP